jgi:hypothetical protein
MAMARSRVKEERMSEQQHIPGTAGSAEQTEEPATGQTTGAESSRLRDRLAALGDRLDRLVASPEVQDARRRLGQAVDDLEARLREAQVADRIEQGLNELSQRVSQFAEGPRGKEVTDRIVQAFNRLEQEVQQALASSRGQELRSRLAGLLRDLGDLVEGRRTAGPAGTPPASDQREEPPART